MVDYDDLAHDFEDTRGKDVPLKLIKRILDLQKIDCSSKVLDLGCGTGRIAITMQLLTGAKITGLDNSTKMLEIAGKKYGHVSWLKDDLDNLKFQDCCFDLILLVFVIHHLQNLESLLRKLKNMLGSNGSLIIVTVSREHIINWPKSLCLDQFPRFIDIDLARFQDINALKILLEGIGYEVNIESFNDETVYKKDDYIERVRKKYLSTLSVLNDKEFELGFRKFLDCINSMGSENIVSKSDFVIIHAKKSQHINRE
ncbi:MAG: class I SAM-dependent methyltransferase [Thermoplasmata archaeon]